ncbi:MAG: shikimate dehydrogenase [Gammaproteobacteria bacterium]
MSEPDRYAVIGHPIAHSKSPVIHKLFAEFTGELIAYEAIDVAPDNLNEWLQHFASEGGRGLNVTVPHKQDALTLMDDLSDRAKLAGAVNTITVMENGDLHGDNTDGVGLITDLRDNLSVELIDSSILILGAGGATRGIIPPLLDEKPVELIIANRTLDRANSLANVFADRGNISASSFAGLEGHAFNLIINATSAGLEGEMPAFPASILGPDTVCYDLSYSMKDTPFIDWAKRQGCTHTYQGWGMLVEQAAESFNIWRGVRPETDKVRAQLP